MLTLFAQRGSVSDFLPPHAAHISRCFLTQYETLNIRTPQSEGISEHAPCLEKSLHTSPCLLHCRHIMTPTTIGASKCSRVDIKSPFQSGPGSVYAEAMKPKPSSMAAIAPRSVTRTKKASIMRERGAFELFPKLPLEIQRMIWKEAAMVPQVVLIERNPDIPWVAAPTSSAKPPSVLHACSESRRVALPQYEISFSRTVAEGTGIYFNFSRDALAFKGYEVLLHFFLAPYFYYRPAVQFPSDRKLFALIIEDMPTRNRLNSRRLRNLGQPLQLFIVREKGAEIGMDEIKCRMDQAVLDLQQRRCPEWRGLLVP